jgi:hypothetical protein
MFKAWIVIRGTQQKFFACPNKYRTFKWPWSVHRTFPFPIEVKATAEFQGGGGELGPAISVVP